MSLDAWEMTRASIETPISQEKPELRTLVQVLIGIITSELIIKRYLIVYFWYWYCFHIALRQMFYSFKASCWSNITIEYEGGVFQMQYGSSFILPKTSNKPEALQKWVRITFMKIECQI